ncbi:MAG: UPF0755 protein [Patiriisocius sp.]|jgi:UPF0755 protein
MSETQPTPRGRSIKKMFKFVLIVSVIIALVLFFYIRLLLTAPNSFLPMTEFEVERGMSARDIAAAAKEEGIVRSELMLYTVIAYSYDPSTIYAGEYAFKTPVGLFDVAKKLATQDIVHDTIPLTIPEGVRLTQIAEIATNTLNDDFDPEEYLVLTKDKEGYLFPETYFVPETFTAEELVELQNDAYEAFIDPLRAKIEVSAFTEYEVLVLASIIEREANDEGSMGMVAGILQNRLDINMALQADASIEYVIDTPLNELAPGQLASELRETDSPYNTYLNTGLPPTPIGNPGSMSILAVLDPIPSDNFFYITDADGQFYYAETFAEHNRNIARYLR